MGKDKCLSDDRDIKQEHFDRPIKGTEVFVGGLARNVTESMIREVFATSGEIAEIRLMKDQNGVSKGYCFVRFATKEAASKAIKEKSGLVMEKKKIGVLPSIEQDSLFLGNLRKDWSVVEFDKIIRQSFQDVVSVDLATYLSSGNTPLGQKQLNRGFAIVQFSSHAAAARAYRIGSKPDFILGGKCHPVVNWADTEPDIDPEELAKIKIAFVSNLPTTVNGEYLKKLFEPLGKLERVALSRKSRFPVGFIHFATRSDLDNAIKEMDGKTVQGPDKGLTFKIQVSVAKTAKPVDKDRKRARDESRSKTARESTSHAKFLKEDQAHDSSGDFILKVPRLQNLTEAPGLSDPYEAAIVSLPAAVAERFLRILRLGIATRFDIGIQCITSLKELTQTEAIIVLDKFMLFGADSHNKGAYLKELIAQVNKLRSNHNSLHSSRVNAFTSRLSELPSLSNKPALGSFASVSGSTSSRYPSYNAYPDLLRYSSSVLDYPRNPRAGFEQSEKPSSFLNRTPVASVDYDSISSSFRFPDAANRQSERPQIRFDPFTGEPYKFDPFTGKPIKPGSVKSQSRKLY